MAELGDADSGSSSVEPGHRMTHRRKLLLLEESEDELPFLKPSTHPMPEPKKAVKLVGMGVEGGGKKEDTPHAGRRKLRKAMLPAEKTKSRTSGQKVGKARRGKKEELRIEDANLVDVPIHLGALLTHTMRSLSPSLVDNDAAAGSSDEEAEQCFEIKRRTKGKEPADIARTNHGRVGMVVAAFEAGMTLNPVGEGSSETVPKD
ncbi:unnamed protein product [Linum trigynum]|uniref:Uncharacterized protein n=1 Tax=Linum trigynum TaxID=586398 RepID=A0AAV2CUD8_9ROSI